LQSFPLSNNDFVDINSLKEIEWSKEFINGVRKIRSEMAIAPGKPLSILIQNWTDQDLHYYKDSDRNICALAKIENVEWLQNDNAPESATALVGEMKILIPLAGLIDKDAEITRLEKEITKLNLNLEKSKLKLNNPNFSDKAPKEVVEKEKTRVTELQSSLSQLIDQLTKIKSIADDKV